MLVPFQMPEKIFVEKIDNFHGMFSFRPLEKGYGTTIGNSLRRVLLSALEGYAITAIKIPGVRHEFSTIDGVKEDLVQILLNLKQVRLKKNIDTDDNKIVISVNNQVFKAGDLSKATASFEVLNPELVICNLAESASFELEVYIEKNRGYLTAEENKPAGELLDVIATDAIFTPIVKVEYYVENIRVEQKIDYEKLVIEIQTDGSIYPEKALKEASKIMIKHLSLICGKEMAFENTDSQAPQMLDEDILNMRKLLQTKISDLDCSARVLNCLKSANIATLGELAGLKLSDMMRFRNFGKKSREEIEQLLADRNLRFDMDLTRYKLHEAY